MRIWVRCLGAGLFWGVLAGTLPAQGGRSDALGRDALTDEQARVLETRLEAQPDDLDTRTKLLDYYSSPRVRRSPEAARARERHVLWLVRHHPEAEIAGSHHAQLYGFDSEAYYKAKALWLEQAKAHAKDVRVLGNAASFVKLEDFSKAEELLKQAQALEPSNPDWPQELGQLYKRRLIGLEGQDRRPVAAKALQYFERAMEITNSRETILDDAARVAVEAGEAEKARSFALELLAGPTEGWNHGNAIHYGNLVLGRLALQSGNVPEARQYLLKAGKTPGSPQLNSFGPSMLLAKELLEKGERDAVLEYLQLCSRFWKMDGDRLKNWSATIRGGGTPDFRMNLGY